MPKVLVAPGSGDIHWVMLKMESIIKKRGWEKPEIWVWSENKRTERSEDYVRRIPFVKWGGYFRAEKHVPFGQQTFVNGRPWIHENWNGFDLFVAFNAPLGWGTHISKLMTDHEINWNYELELTEDDQYYGQRYRKKHGPFVLLSFFGHSFYKNWLKHFSLDNIQFLISRLYLNYTLVLTGREWDISFMRRIGGPVEDLTAQTSMGQLLGLCSAASAFIGFAAGNGMLAQHLNCPTFMLWDPLQWSPEFAINWVDPRRREKGIYHALDIHNPNVIPYIVERLNGRDLSTDSAAQRDVVPD